MPQGDVNVLTKKLEPWINLERELLNCFTVCTRGVFQYVMGISFPAVYVQESSHARAYNINRRLLYSTNLNCTDNYDVAKIKMKSVTDHQ